MAAETWRWNVRSAFTVSFNAAKCSSNSAHSSSETQQYYFDFRGKVVPDLVGVLSYIRPASLERAFYIKLYQSLGTLCLGENPLFFSNSFISVNA